MVLVPLPSVALEAQRLALREACGLCALDDLAVLTVTGNDRASWLNGVVTNDTRNLAAGQSAYAAAVAVKGRLLADLWVHARADALLLVVPSAQCETLLAHFERYVVMEDVALARHEARVVSLQGPHAATVAGRFPERFSADRLGRGGWDLIADPSFESMLQAVVAEGLATVVSREAWEAERIEALVPGFGVDFDTSNFVQEAAITARAVSFNKGCYLGQEVVCRLEMRGQVQKQLVGLAVPGAVPAMGAKVVSDGQEVGVVTSAAPALGGGAVALAMVKRAAVEKSSALTIGEATATLLRTRGA